MRYRKQRKRVETKAEEAQGPGQRRGPSAGQADRREGKKGEKQSDGGTKWQGREGRPD